MWAWAWTRLGVAEDPPLLPSQPKPMHVPVSKKRLGRQGVGNMTKRARHPDQGTVQSGVVPFGPTWTSVEEQAFYKHMEADNEGTQ